MCVEKHILPGPTESYHQQCWPPTKIHRNIRNIPNWIPGRLPTHITRLAVCLPHYIALHHIQLITYLEPFGKQAFFGGIEPSFCFARISRPSPPDITFFKKELLWSSVHGVFDVRKKWEGIRYLFVPVGCKGFGIWQRSRRSRGRVKAGMGNLCAPLEAAPHP